MKVKPKLLEIVKFASISFDKKLTYYVCLVSPEKQAVINFCSKQNGKLSLI